MLISYLKTALRNLARHRLYAFINITGLALGLCVFLFSWILIQYEYDHDHMFPKREQIFTVGSVFARTSEESVREYPVVRTAFGPLFRAEIKDAGTVVRVLHRETLVKPSHPTAAVRYEYLRYAEPGFTRLFDFQYIHGNARALDNPRGLILTESAARRLFGRVDVLGEAVALEYKYASRVTAVVRDVGPDSHFNSSYLPGFTLSVIAPLEALVQMGNFKRAGDMETLDPADMTYILLPPKRDRVWLQKKVAAVYARHTTPAERKYIKEVKVRPLVDANVIIWDAMGFPVLQSVRLLGFLILLIACANYTNLATAQNLGRAREVGLRKTFGARPSHLLVQFLLESLALTMFSMLIALAALELLIPAYNDVTGKAVVLDYAALSAMVAAITLLTGILAGIYPSYLISRKGPMEALRNTPAGGSSGNTLRGMMVAGQFSISIFILALVLIIFFQNRKVLTIGETWPRFDIVVLDRMNAPEVRRKRHELRRAVTDLPGVRSMSFSSGVPFYETSRTQKLRRASVRPGDAANAVVLDMVSVDAEFMKTYGMEIIAGRSLDANIPGDIFTNSTKPLPVVINCKAALELGFPDDERVIGKSFSVFPEKDSPRRRTYTVVGLMADRYFIGPQSPIRPMFFLIQPEMDYYASIRLEGSERRVTLRAVDEAWNRIIKNYPIRRKFLDAYFQLFYGLLKGLNAIMAIFAGIALYLACIGLFGLSAFLARRRTKEIGIRKAMGADVGNIVLLLARRFSRPVLWSLLIAMPAAYLAADIYLNFFPERITFVVPLILLAGLGAVLSAWLITAGHALRIARIPPGGSLRNE